MISKTHHNLNIRKFRQDTAYCSASIVDILPLSLYDLVITHEPAESDYELVIQLDHLGKYDGSEPHPYQCAVNKNSATPQQAYGSQILTVTVKAGGV